MHIPGARVGGLAWSEEPLWGRIYGFLVDNETVGRPLWWASGAGDLRRLRDAAGEIGGLPAGSVVLDVPCGTGVALLGLRPGQGLRYVAADISERMLDRTLHLARRRSLDDQVETCACDVGALPFADATVDMVVSFTGLHCFPDPHRAVREMTRVLRPGGVLRGSALLTDLPLGLPLRLAGRLGGLVGESASSAQLRSWLVEGGLVDIEVDGSGGMGYFRAVAAT